MPKMRYFYYETIKAKSLSVREPALRPPAFAKRPHKQVALPH